MSGLNVRLNGQDNPVSGIELEDAQSSEAMHVACHQAGYVTGIDEDTSQLLSTQQEAFVMFDDGRVIRVLAQMSGNVLECTIIESKEEQVDSRLWAGGGWPP